MARDWVSVKAAYIAGATASELAEQFEISKATIESRASREKWGALRKATATQVDAGLQAAVADALLDQAVDAGVLTSIEVLRELSAIARGGIHKVATWGPEGVVFRPLSELTLEDARLVAEVSETPGKYGPNRRIKLYDKMAALLALAKYHGLLGENGANGAANKKNDQPAGVIELPMLDPPPMPPEDEG